MERWRLLDLESSDPYRNIALEEAIFQTVGMGVAPNTVRLWRNPNSVVIGRYQSVYQEVNMEACEEYNTVVVRRFTGGGSVYHDLGNLNWTFVADGVPSTYRNLFKAFEFYGRPVVEGLREIGVHAVFHPPNSICVNDMKVSGLALHASRRTTLCHGTLLVDTDLSVLKRVLLAPRKPTDAFRRPRWVESRWSTVTNLQEESSKTLSLSDVKRSIVEGIQKSYGINLCLGLLSHREMDIVERLYEDKYARTEWNMKM